MIAFDLQRDAAVLARGARVEKCVDLALEHAVLDGGEELLGFLERQTEMLNAGGVLLQGDEVCHCFSPATIATHAQLQFDAHGEGSFGSGGGEMMQVILPEFVAYPQLLHALDGDCYSPDHGTQCSAPLSDVSSRPESRRLVAAARQSTAAQALSGAGVQEHASPGNGPRQAE